MTAVWETVIFSRGTILEVINGAKMALNYLFTFLPIAKCGGQIELYPPYIGAPGGPLDACRLTADSNFPINEQSGLRTTV